MAKAARNQAEEAGFKTAKDYNEFLDELSTDHDGFMALPKADRESWIRQWDDGNGAGNLPVPAPDENPVDPADVGAAKERRDLSPAALGFDVQNVKDIPDDMLPDFSTVNSKYGEYFKALDDSFNNGMKWKMVENVADVQALQNALRSAASKRSYGLEYRYTQDENGEPDGNVYFRAQEKRVKKPNGSGSEEAS
jgi:hypothetical protein